MTELDAESNKESEEVDVRRSLFLLFAEHVEIEIAEELRYVSAYLDFLSKRIDYRRARINAPMDLVRSFESVVLLLRDRLDPLPGDIKSQVDDLLKKHSVSTTLATYGELSEGDTHSVTKAALRWVLPSLLRTFLTMADVVILKRVEVDELGLTPKALLEAKIQLTRLAQIAKYASTLDAVRPEPIGEDYSDQFNPERIDRDKINALVSALKVQIGDIPDSNVRGRLERSVAELEREVRRHRPRWTRIVGMLFVLSSVLSNLKTLAPDTYDRSLRTIETIIEVIRQEGQVNPARQKLLTTSDRNDQGPLPPEPRQVAINPRRDDELEGAPGR